MSNNNNTPTIIGVTKDVVGLGAKVVAGSFSLLAFGVAKAHNAVDFAIDASAEGYQAGKSPKQLELDLTPPENES